MLIRVIDQVNNETEGGQSAETKKCWPILFDLAEVGLARKGFEPRWTRNGISVMMACTFAERPAEDVGPY